MKMPSLQKLTLSVLGVVVFLEAWRALIGFPNISLLPVDAPKPPILPCIGEPINVPHAFDGNVVAPHSCLPQCEDLKPRYLLYTNGVATQCDTPPSCNDRGEDDGITCTPPDPASRIMSAVPLQGSR